MATGTSLVEVDVPRRPSIRADEPGAAARFGRRWRRAARWTLGGLLVLGVVVGSPATSSSSAEASESAPVQDSEMLDFDTAYMVCRESFLSGTIAEAWFADAPAVLSIEHDYREQLENGEIRERDYLDNMEQLYGIYFDKWDFYRETVIPTGSSPNCQALADSDQSPPTTTTTATTSTTMGPMPTSTTTPTAEDGDEGEEGEDAGDTEDDEDVEEAVGPYSEANYVMGDDESCDAVDEVGSTGRGGGRFESYRVYGDEFLALGNGNGAREIAENDDVCIPRGYVLITCRDENDHWVDDWGVVQVHADLPTWWFQAVYDESLVDEGNSCEMVTHKPSKSCEEIVGLVTINVTAGYSVTDSYTLRDGDSGYDSPGIIPDKCWGTYPTAMYQISWHEGDTPTAWDDNLMGWLTDLTFGLGKGAITAALWVVEFGFDFRITQYADVVGNIADNYQVHLIGPFDLLGIVWFALIAWVAIMALRGKLAMAGGELVMTLVLLTLATTMYNPLMAGEGEGEGLDLGYFRDTAVFMDLSSKAMLSAAQGEDPTDDDDIIRVLERLQGQVHRQFVELPHEYLNWGSVLPDECDDAAYQVMAANYDDDGWPARHMKRAHEDCEEFATYNDDANSTRLFGAVLTMIVSVIVALTLGITAFTVLVCKFLLAVLFATTPFIVLSAVLPGTGRRLFWSWGGSLLQLVLAVIGSGGLVALELIGVDAVVAKTEDQDLIARWFLVLMIVATVFFARRKMIALAQRWATSTTDNLTRLSPGSAHWSGGGSVGFDLDRVDRGAMQSLRAAGYGAAIGAYAGGYAAWAGIRGVTRSGLNLGRDMRNRRFAARNLAYNRQMLHQYEERPKRRYVRQPDGSFKEDGVTISMPDPVTAKERRWHQQVLDGAERTGPKPRVEVTDHGKNPKTTRLLNTYRPRQRQPKPPKTPRMPRMPRTPRTPRTPKLPKTSKLPKTPRTPWAPPNEPRKPWSPPGTPRKPWTPPRTPRKRWKP